jgi:HK97 family phage portal protein
MSALLPALQFDSDPALAKHFMPHQINWIVAEDAIHARHQQVFALAEKSVRIGWTHADSFKNVRKRLRFKNRDYLFVTKDYPSALEYMRLTWHFAELFDLTRTIISHGEQDLKVPRIDDRGRATGFTEEIKIGVIKFDNGSRIIAFSANPQAMAVYGGDVGLDEFAKHPNAELLWETAQGRITWGFDIAVWSAHNGDDTLFYQFCRHARACSSSSLSSSSSLLVSPSTIQHPVSTIKHLAPLSPIQNQNSKIQNPTILCPWNLYYRVTMPDAIELGLVDVINRERNTRFTPEQFLADCRSRAGHEHIFQQTYMCNPVPGGASIVNNASPLRRPSIENQKSKIKNILILDPSRFQHIVQANQLIGWRYTAFGKDAPLESQVFLPEEVWFEKLPNPFDFWRGLAPLYVADLAAKTDFAAASFMRGFLENNADNGLIIRTNEQLDEEQREQVLAALRRRKRRAGTADGPLLLRNNAEIVKPTLSSADLQFLENRKFTRSEICAAFGVPEEIVSTTDHSKYDVMQGARLNFIENRVAPLCARLEAEEERAVKAIDPAAVGWFDLDALPIMQAARRDRLAAAKTGFDMGIPFNELNRILDLGFKPLPWGDTGYLPNSLTPLAPSSPLPDVGTLPAAPHSLSAAGDRHVGRVTPRAPKKSSSPSPHREERAGERRPASDDLPDKLERLLDLLRRRTARPPAAPPSLSAGAEGQGADAVNRKP